ncbi:dihydrolipoamide dehydrogenase [Caldisphaera lagunensis DSM 15908]|uniref:Dihydrolipoyl dehydrogenase n=1 Tax=Caldisphaera lagunensis (strain DSM 15908 / JCM 11604 / ANMR 0165 / IC-154) TaxID=1056495 RepID=L0AD31_CALLD|nr:dihydrolipoyl dehydrogenase [Caldisphaera lagunensis]AFZ70960.1 dihydrolipoamide dehydrogenase [Caldisphaera lagunensis DSM 15908]
MELYDLIVIGGGPAGYPAAIRASQLGLRVALIEKNKLGGECTNYGCIPTKALIKSSYENKDFKDAIEEAISASDKVREGISFLLKNNKVDVFYNEAKIEENNEMFIEENNNIKSKKLIIATGTEPIDLPNLKVDGKLIHNNRTILNLKEKPSSLLIIGAGYVGVEFANAFSKLDSKVTLIEAMPRILPNLDPDISRLAERSLRNKGIKIYKNTTIKEVKEIRENYIKININNEDMEFDSVLISIGRKPVLPNIKVERDEKSFIKTDKYLRTSNPNVFAAGDITGNPMLAHKAFVQGVVAAEGILNMLKEIDYNIIPSVVFSNPEIFSVGYTLNQANSLGLNARETKLPLGGLARSVIEKEEIGLIKIVYDSSNRIIGVHAIADHASEIALSATLAVKLKASLEDLSFSMPPHPTMSEALKEVAELALNRPIHYTKI